MKETSGGKFGKCYFSFQDKKGRIHFWWTFRANENFLKYISEGFLNCRVVCCGKLIMRGATYKGV